MSLTALLIEADFKDKFEGAILAKFKALEDNSRGGRERAKRFADRNTNLAREYLTKRNGATGSDSALKASIGKKRHGLSRSQSIAAIDDGLKKLSG